MNNLETTWVFEQPRGARNESVPENASGGDLRLQVRLCEHDEDAFAPLGQTPIFQVSLPGPTRESAPSRASDRAAPTLAELREAGAVLWRRLPEALVAATRDRSGGGGRLRVSSEISAVSDLPWEWLTDANGARPWTTVRSIPVVVTPPPLTVQPPLRVLVFLTNPHENSDLDIEREMAVVRPALGPNFEVRELLEATIEEATAALRNFQPHIVHYIGHSGVSHGGGSIMLRSSGRATHWVDAADIAPVLPLSVRLICLATCVSISNYNVRGLSWLAHAPGELKLPTMIANRYSVSDAGARKFWLRFYADLIEASGNVASAFVHAQDEVLKRFPKKADWGSFELIIRDGSGHPIRLREDEAPGRFAAEVQAQFAAQVANEIAQKAKVLGELASPSLKQHLSEEHARAIDFSSKIPE